MGEHSGDKSYLFAETADAATPPRNGEQAKDTGRR